MAVVLLEGFDHFGGGEEDKKGWIWELNAGTFNTGRLGGQAIYQNTSGGLGSCVRKSLGGDYGTLYLGCAFRFGSFNAANSVYFCDGTGGPTDTGSMQLGFRISGTGAFQVFSGSSTLAETAALFSINTWYYVELYALIHNSAGAYTLRVNGVQLLTGSGVDTSATGNAYASTVRLRSTQNGACYWDDLYILDDTGGAPLNTFLGDIRIETIFPSGNGNSSQFVGSDGNSTDNYLLVDDTTAPDEDSTYVESATVSDKDTYAFGDLSVSSGTIFAVNPIVYTRKTDAGSRSIAVVARLSGGTEEDGSNISLPTSYTFYNSLRTTKPGGGAWSISDVNGAEFGYKVTA